MGLCQSNMAWLTGKRGVQYHWLLDLFRRLKLPLLDGMEDALRKTNDERAKKINLKEKEKKERNRTRSKEAMVTGTSHGYGDDELDVEADDDEGASDLISLTTVTGLDVSVATSKKTCKCGSNKHLRTSHLECPLRKDKG